MTTPTDTTDSDAIITIVRVRATGGGHFRAGLHHGPEMVDWPPGALDARQLEQLQSDPRLVVELLEIPASGAGAAAKATPKATPKAKAATPKTNQKKK